MEIPPDSNKKPYGTTRSRRASVSYGEVERAATALLKAGQRPTIEKLRESLGGGAPDTITNALSRYWKDLGTRIEGDPASLSRLPAEVADLADSVWRRALSLAADAAIQKAGSERHGLEFFKRENELKAHALSLKEKELDAQLRSRERTIQELETHLRTAMGFVQQKEETIRALETRIAQLDSERDGFFRRLGSFTERVGSQRRSAKKRADGTAPPTKSKAKSTSGLPRSGRLPPGRNGLTSKRGRRR